MIALLKLLDLVPSWVWALVTALALVTAGGMYVRANNVRTEFSAYKAEVALQTARATNEARAREAALQRQADSIARSAHVRETKLRANAATTELVAGQLRDDIARLNARPVPEDARAAAYAHEASAARELLGACTNEYRGVAQAADGLRDQVTGLQDFIHQVIKSSP